MENMNRAENLNVSLLSQCKHLDNLVNNRQNIIYSVSG